MASSEARRQKKLQKKKTKRQEKHRVLAQRTSNDPGIVLRDIESWPIHDVRVPSKLWELGMGTLLIARWTPQRQLVVAGYLLDTFYLGVKDTFWRICTPSQYSAMVQGTAAKSGGSMQKVDTAYFVKLIHEMVAWSQAKTGSSPHPDFRHTSKLLAGIDISPCAAIFEFGKDGQPMFISGPYDSFADDDLFDEGNDNEEMIADEVDDDYVVEGQVVKVWDKP